MTTDRGTHFTQDAEAEWEQAYSEAMRWRDWQTCDILLEERETAEWWLNRERDDDE